MRPELFSTRGFVLYRDLGTLLQERFISQHSLLQQRVEERFVAPGGGKQQRGQGGAVFRNRLKLGMKLDCDPTTIYAALLEGRYRGTIHQSDLASANRYNTYQHAGLPPGPIANPGAASLRAALHPAEADYLYFVARPDGSGRHQFSKDIEAHRLAASRYRRGHAK